MRVMARFSDSGVAALAIPAETIIHESKRQRMSVTRRGRGGDAGGCSVSFGVFDSVCLFMLDVRWLLLIIHVGVMRARLE
jgi:hypothetical protein